METLTSADGTTIAYEKEGAGPALIVVDGALCARLSNDKPHLVDLLAPDFTMYIYDRRGRGDSGDTPPYAVEREIEDIDALIEDAGGTAFLYGHSSGAALALEAAVVLGKKVPKIAMYEAPYNDEPEARRAWAVYLRELDSALRENRRGDAVALFIAYVGTPAEQIAGMRQAPFWSGLEALAPTLAYDHTGIMGPEDSIPYARVGQVDVPALVMHGSDGAPFMGVTARALRTAMPHAQLRTLEGQTHDVSPDALAPLLREFFAS